MKKLLIYACLAIFEFTGCVRASNNSNPDTDMTLTIYHYKVPGAGEDIQLCYLIKTEKGEKEFFYDEIKDFKFQWGYNYLLSVDKQILTGVKTGASAITYKLKKIISKQRVAANEQFELPISFNERIMVENKNGSCSYFNDIPITTPGASCDKLMKAQLAIFKYNADFSALVVVKLK